MPKSSRTVFGLLKAVLGPVLLSHFLHTIRASLTFLWTPCQGLKTLPGAAVIMNGTDLHRVPTSSCTSAAGSGSQIFWSLLFAVFHQSASIPLPWGQKISSQPLLFMLPVFCPLNAFSIASLEKEYLIVRFLKFLINPEVFAICIPSLCLSVLIP